MEGLSEIDRAFLAHLGSGGTSAGFARTNHYSKHWAKWESRKLRHKLGVRTLREAVAMAEGEEGGVSRTDFDKLTGLVSRLGEAVEDLARARPAEQPAAQQQVVERQLDPKDHAKALGLSLDDVAKLRDEKDYERFKGFLDRYEQEEPETPEENGGTGIVDRVRDGLGGIRNVKP